MPRNSIADSLVCDEIFHVGLVGTSKVKKRVGIFEGAMRSFQKLVNLSK